MSGVPAGRRRARGPFRAVSGLTAVALLVPIGWALLTGAGQTNRQLALSAGGAWVLTPEKGLATLIDGASDQLVATIQLPFTGGGLSITQDGSSAFLADDTSGTVTRIDGATYQLSAPVRFGAAGSDLTVLAADDSAFVVDASARTASAVTRSLSVQRTVAMSARPGAGQTLISAGRLWAVDGDGSGLSWYDPDGDSGHGLATASSRLLEVNGRPALVDVDQVQPPISWLRADGTRGDWVCRLSSSAGDRVQLLGDAAGTAVFAAVSESGTLLLVDEDSGRCDEVATIGDPGAVFGDLVQSGRFVFVPNHATGDTVVVDTGSGLVVATLPLTEPNNDLELIAKDGLIFYNDRSSHRAGVLHESTDGSWVAGPTLEKFDPVTGEAAVLVTSAPDVAPEVPAVPADVPPADPAQVSDAAVVPPADLPADPAAAVPPPANPPPANPPPANPPPANPPPANPPPANPPPANPPPANPPPANPPPASPPPANPPPGNPPPADPPPADPPPADPPPADPPPAVPVVNGIDGPAELTFGAEATFTASVDNAGDGPWHWVALADGATPISESTDAGPFTVTVPFQDASSVLVTLTVGGSQPGERSFPVTLARTYTSIGLGRSVAWTPSGTADGDAVQLSVSVVNGDGNPIEGGRVHLSHTVDDGVRAPVIVDDGFADVGLGSAQFPDQSSVEAGTWTFTAEYEPSDPGRAPSTSEPAQLVFEIQPQILDGGCGHQDGQAYVWAVVYPDNPSAGGQQSLWASVRSSLQQEPLASGSMEYDGPGGGSGEARYRLFVDSGVISSFNDLVVGGSQNSSGRELEEVQMPLHDDCLL